MSDEVETVPKSIMLERLAAKDRANAAEVELLRAKIGKLEAAAASVPDLTAERDALAERVAAADIASAFRAAGLGGDESEALRGAIVERWKSSPVDDGAERPAFSDWLTTSAPDDPLISIHLRGPADDDGSDLSRATTTAAGPPSAAPTPRGPAAAGLNHGARAPQSDARPRLAPAALRDRMRAELSKTAPGKRREVVERYRTEYGIG
jgi:hypothetical protein